VIDAENLLSEIIILNEQCKTAREGLFLGHGRHLVNEK